MLEKLRIQLAAVEALPQLLLMSVLSGLLAGAVIILFRVVVESVQSAYLPQGQPENFEELAVIYQLLIPTLGGLFIGLWFQFSSVETRIVGVVHVMERLAYHQGYLPLRNAIQQFVGAAVCIISGHSVGREGPIVHLGAASGSLLGQWLKLPNNSIRTLVACGSAAAIAASFNTPLAGVIFAMEVVMMEYTVIGFTPVILAAVIGAVMTRLVYGPSPAFNLPPLELVSLQLELPYLLLMGVIIGTLAAGFIHLLQVFSRSWESGHFWERTTAAGFITGLCGLFIPQVMGVGYDTVNAILVEQLSLNLMLGVVFFKILITTLGLGLGLPGGLIGPSLMIGAAAGGVMGIFAESLFPNQASSSAMYAMLGMGAMMGATLQAPLAALIALLELTANPNIILPGMLVIVVSDLVASSGFKKDSVFVELMRARGLDYHNDPIAQSLRRVGVASAMERDFIVLPRILERAVAETVLDQQPVWILIEEQNQPSHLLLAADLVHFLNRDDLPDLLDLIAIPGRRQQLAAIHSQATLQEALELINETQVEALYVVPHSLSSEVGMIYGILTRQDIEYKYLFSIKTQSVNENVTKDDLVK